MVNRSSHIFTILASPFLLHGLCFAHQNEPMVRGVELKSDIHATGTEIVHGSAQKFVMHVTRSFEYRFDIIGNMPETDGFDGKTAWHLGGAGVPHIASYSDRDLTRIVAYIQAGVWACKNSPIEIVSEKGNDLVIKCKDGSTTVNLTLDPKTHTAMKLTSWGPSGNEVWKFSDYILFSGILVPKVIAHENGDTVDTATIKEMSPNFGGTINFKMPAATSDGYTFDLAANPQIEVKRKFGYLFVRPKVDGKDEGWWFLDTGAEVMVIDPELAKTHKMKAVGNDSVSGVVANVKTSFWKGIEFQLGPVTIRNSSYMELEMKQFTDGFGMNVVGICGYDFISRVAMDIDPTKATLGIYPAGKAALPTNGAWTSFLFHGNMPSLSCNFEGNHQGLFSLDTGSGSTVDFFSPAVSKYELLKDRKVSSVMTGGAGGASESKMGPLDWFIFGSKKFEKPVVGFQTTTKGGFASPFVDGNIGMQFMGKFRMILDYQNSRLALIEAKN